MLNKCCDCKKFLGIKLPFLDFSITHGICRKCYLKYMWLSIIKKVKTY